MSFNIKVIGTVHKLSHKKHMNRIGRMIWQNFESDAQSKNFKPANTKANSWNPELKDEVINMVSKVESHPNSNQGDDQISGKPGCFIVGADFTTLEKFKAVEEVRQEMLDSIGNETKPIIAAIQDSCLLGGLEVVMARKYRVAVNDRKPALSLPEVIPEILPGTGTKAKKIGLDNQLVAPLGPGFASPDDSKRKKLTDIEKDSYSAKADIFIDVINEMESVAPPYAIIGTKTRTNPIAKITHRSNISKSIYNGLQVRHFSTLSKKNGVNTVMSFANHDRVHIRYQSEEIQGDVIVTKNCDNKKWKMIYENAQKQWEAEKKKLEAEMLSQQEIFEKEKMELLEALVGRAFHPDGASRGKVVGEDDDSKKKKLGSSNSNGFASWKCPLG